MDIDETSYELDNMKNENSVIVFKKLSTELNNLPFFTKEIWIDKNVGLDITEKIKLPFGCKICFF
jgi:hypothetical protein